MRAFYLGFEPVCRAQKSRRGWVIGLRIPQVTMPELLELGSIRFTDRNEKPDFLVGRVFVFTRDSRREEGSAT